MKLKLLPSEAFTIHTEDSIEIVCQKLMAQIKNSNIVQKSQERAIFKGKVSEGGFEISRIINYKNLFLPIIYGKFKATPNGTIIHTNIELNSLVIRFFWNTYFSFYFLLLTTSILKLLVDLEIVVISSLVSLSLKSIPSELLASLIFGSYFILMLIKRILKDSFQKEVRIVRKQLTKIFLGQLLLEENEIDR